ncbi:class I SAM-dependent methyltransferase [Candidatus Altiarchaeota archaeon]
MSDWDSIYREQGMIQKEPKQFIIDNIKTLRDNDVKRVLDVGCGTGRHVTLLVDEGFNVSGMDKSGKAIEMLGAILADKEAGDVELKVGDFTQLEYPDGSFDAVLCNSVIQHAMMEDIRKAASEITRVLRKNGILLLSTLSTSDDAYGMGQELEDNTYITGVAPDGDVPHHFFTKQELHDLFTGFEILSLEEKTMGSSLRDVEKMSQWFLTGRKT